ncbi:hypothetical protein [Streptomyces sp. G-G2]|uniref:WXG100 family type VII secretion target n=1 Tax=Streptomyces sp. G-G2 TaxID=3046201 RepID=UPI0024BB5507|nr:hypothetical protein [Streptomyces sp. G-G2]MDJ0379579.1 hypothetical protein [Streptomyces sp. G-G2]
MTTNFEAYSHKDLLAMVAAVNPETVKTLGQLLTDAESTITKIGNDLKNHKVEGWQGKASEEFQEWVNAAGNATLRLGEYSQTGGTWMTNAAQTLVEVKANMPKYDTAAADNLQASKDYHNDPDARDVGQKAFTKLNGDHALAVQQMTKLAQSYEASTTQMNTAVPPTYPPPPGRFVPESVGGRENVGRAGSGSDGTRDASNTSSGHVARAENDSSGHTTTSTQQVSHDSTLPPSTTGPDSGQTHVPSVPDHNVGTDLNTVGTLPDKPVTQVPGTPVGIGPSGPGGGGAGPIGTIPPLTLPSVGGMKSPTGGISGGRSPISGVGPGGGFPNTSATGGKVGGVAGLPPRDAGITGGRPISAGGRASSIPRGTVIGNEGGPAGRGMAGGIGGAGGMGGGTGGQGGSAVGRRLASEPGGVVGGRQPGAGGRSTTGGKPFTQGGSGLVRNQGGGAAGGVGGAMGHAGAGTGGKKRNDQAGERPDYLAEDEETWQGDRRVVPPVID